MCKIFPRSSLVSSLALPPFPPCVLLVVAVVVCVWGSPAVVAAADLLHGFTIEEVGKVG